MLPRLQHRLLIGSALVIGGLSLLYARGALTAADGSNGLSLIDARVGLFVAVLILLAAGLPAIFGALLCSATGNSMAGAFCLSSSLLILASMGGPIDGFFQRAHLPQDYTRLAIEAGVWLVLLAVVLMIVDRLRVRVRPKLSKITSKQHLGATTRLGVPDFRSILAGLVTAAFGAFLCNLLIQASDSGQVNGALILGFTLAAIAGQMAVPQRNPLMILVSPLIVAAGAYLWVAYSYHSTDALLVHYYRHDLLNLALGLPIQYASAGVAGCAMGIGMAQSLEYVRQTTAVTVH